MVTALALAPQEPMSQDPAAQVLVELFDHEVWKRVPGILDDLILELEPVVLDDSVEDRPFGLVPGIGELLECGVGFDHRLAGLAILPAR